MNLNYYKSKARKRLLSFIRVNENGCWIFTGHIKKGGYGEFKIYKKMHKAHRVSMHLFRDFDLYSSLLILHRDDLCNSKACINPDHLKEGDYAENNNDARIKGTKFVEHNKYKTHCLAGHPYSKENTWKDWKGHRHCRTCHNNTERKRQQVKKEKQKQLKSKLG